MSANHTPAAAIPAAGYIDKALRCFEVDARKIASGFLADYRITRLDPRLTPDERNLLDATHDALLSCLDETSFIGSAS